MGVSVLSWLPSRDREGADAGAFFNKLLALKREAKISPPIGALINVSSVPLRPLHPDDSLSPAKLGQLDRLTTEQLLASLLPVQKDSLKTRQDGTILDGHHRVFILRQRGTDVDSLPREVILKTGIE
jgi:hypothetical protein